MYWLSSFNTSTMTSRQGICFENITILSYIWHRYYLEVALICITLFFLLILLSSMNIFFECSLYLNETILHLQLFFFILKQITSKICREVVHIPWHIRDMTCLCRIYVILHDKSPDEVQLKPIHWVQYPVSLYVFLRYLTCTAYGK